MSFLIRQVGPGDLASLHRLASSLSAQGFLTLPAEERELAELIRLSQDSFADEGRHKDKAQYLFVLEAKGVVVGSSLVIARHGTPESPHLYFEVDSKKKSLKLKSETKGRTELGGLILDPAYRRNAEKLGKRLSLARLLYIGRNPERFRKELLAEFLPPFTADGKSALWEEVGRKFTGIDYREADLLARKEKKFVKACFPKEIPIEALSPEAQRMIGLPGEAARPAVKILTDAGFRYLHQVDPFDGGPHYGCKLNTIRWKEIGAFLEGATEVKIIL